ncbi:MAG: hypothetical protein RBR77_04060 [Thauera sp.]|jgi:hypothetical protein|nr:hypothetical protein [Thauera sp.]
MIGTREYGYFDFINESAKRLGQQWPWPSIETVADNLQKVESAMRAQKGLEQLERSDGSTASYYELPEGATELQHLISDRNMNAQIGEIFRACYRYGRVEHSEMLRDAKKILFYAKAEVERLEKLQGKA